ncbi:MAG: hypothetical protein RL258_1595 [Pseudomonadota bacterium]
MPPVVILTGGMGAGKSTAARAFTNLGISVVDADALAHGVTGPGGLALPALRAAFGEALVSEAAGLDRVAMRTQAFEDPEIRQRLEAIVHPLVAEQAEQRLAAAEGPYAVYMVPLWIERQGADRAGWPDWAWRVVVIDLPEPVQRSRILARSPMPEETLQAMLARQAGRSERLAIADYAIANDQGPEALALAITCLHDRLLRDLAATDAHANQT